MHEVSLISGVISNVCTTSSCDVVLDIGAGLGYLGDCLSKQCGLVVICLEREESRVEASEKRARSHAKWMPQCEESCESHMTSTSMVSGAEREEGVVTWLDKVRQCLPPSLNSPCKLSLQMNVDHSPTTTIKLSFLLDCIKERMSAVPKICIVGLHCCGDLSDAVLKTFTSHCHSGIKSLVLLGCCYHKTEHAQWKPLSREVMSLLQAHRVESMSSSGDISKYGLRLAAQETRGRWRVQTSEEHKGHMTDVGFRGILEVVCLRRQIPSIPRQQLRKIKFQCFQEYARSVASNLQEPGMEHALLDCFKIHEHHMKYIEPFTALQVCMQGALESLVLLDRLAYLKESGYSHAKLVPVFSSLISPRNMALILSLLM